MGTNINPGVNGGFVIKGRPEEYNKMIGRQGQLVRLIHAKKCSCIKNGFPDIHCSYCGGKGFFLFFQEDFDIFQENSPHGVCGEFSKINPYYIPISKVRSVQRRLHASQCSNANGLTDYTVSTFDDTTITLVDNENLPKRYERIQVSYAFKNAEEITDENSTHTGQVIGGSFNYFPLGYLPVGYFPENYPGFEAEGIPSTVSENAYRIETTATEYKETHIADTLNVHGDILSVSRVYNVTQNYTYTVLSFKKNIIILDEESGVAPVPLSTDTLEVDYKYIPIFYAILLQVQTENAVQKWGEDVKLGDIRIILPGYYHIDRFSIITAMTTILQNKVVITKGISDTDEIPSFDVFEIIGNIEDEDDNEYINGTHFELEEFNNLVWLTDTKPSQGKKYSVNYSYRPSYQVYRQQSKTMNLGQDGRYPIMTFARFLNRFSVKDFDKL